MYTVTRLTPVTRYVFRCRQCQHPGWSWFPRGSNVKRKPAVPATFLVGSPTALPKGVVKLCEDHTRALVGDAVVDSTTESENV